MKISFTVKEYCQNIHLFLFVAHEFSYWVANQGISIDSYSIERFDNVLPPKCYIIKHHKTTEWEHIIRIFSLCKSYRRIFGNSCFYRYLPWDHMLPERRCNKFLLFIFNVLSSEQLWKEFVLPTIINQACVLGSAICIHGASDSLTKGWYSSESFCGRKLWLTRPGTDESGLLFFRLTLSNGRGCTKSLHLEAKYVLKTERRC